ncbi:MAG: alpha/beta fold hydrolase [Planctomycetota bacterium]
MPVHETFRTGRERRLHGQCWSADHPKALVILVHGLGDHSGRYESFATSLISDTEIPLAVAAFDLPGHGKSAGKPGSAGWYFNLLHDIAVVRRDLGRTMPSIPQILMGHSMGGNLVANYALRRRKIDLAVDEVTDPPAGLILAAPMLQPPKPLPRPMVFAAWATGYLAPFIRFGSPVSVEHLTSDRVEQEHMLSDRNLHGRISLHLATQLVSQGRWVLDRARDIHCPVLMVRGALDPLIDNSAIENMVIRGGEHFQELSLEKSRHSMFHDVERVEAIQSCANWISNLTW